MILVVASILARPETAEEMARLTVEHCRRSRAEAGCLAHAVHRDVEEPLRFVFVERWADRAALDAHATVATVRDTVRRLGALAAERPAMMVYDAHGTAAA